MIDLLDCRVINGKNGFTVQKKEIKSLSSQLQSQISHNHYGGLRKMTLLGCVALLDWVWSCWKCVTVKGGFAVSFLKLQSVVTIS